MFVLIHGSAGVGATLLSLAQSVAHYPAAPPATLAQRAVEFASQVLLSPVVTLAARSALPSLFPHPLLSFALLLANSFLWAVVIWYCTAWLSRRAAGRATPAA